MQDADTTKEQLLKELTQCREEFKKFSYIVSHDLRTPLINLKGFSAELRFAVETIQSAVTPLLSHLDDTQRSAVTTAIEQDIPECLEFIEFSVTRIDSFMNSVLKLSRLGRRELKLEPVDMDAVVQNARESLASEIEKHHAEIVVRSPLPQVMADRASMNEIVEIVLKNAVLYLEPDRPGRIEISGERGADETVFVVRDNGRGIAASEMHKVFEPFRRAGKQDVPGDGMGLVYAQTLIRHLGGRIKCASELGTGTSIILTVPEHSTEGGDYAQ